MSAKAVDSSNLADGRETPRWWLIVAVAGVLSGLAGVAMTVLLHILQHLAFGHPEDTFLYGVEHATAAHRVTMLTVAGLIAGIGWSVLRWLCAVRTVGEAVGESHQPLPITGTTADACLQVVVVGMGASLGREGAPRQVAAALGSWLARRGALDPEQRRILIASCAGAGLAAVYNVPLGGVLFSAEVLLGSLSMQVVLPAALTSAVATAVSWTVLGNHPIYDLPPLHLTSSLLVWSVLVGPIIGAVAYAFDTVTTWSKTHAARGPRAIPTAVACFAILGVAAIAYPQLLGNGQGALQTALTGSIGLGAAAALIVLKPLATALCLRSGAVGGLLTPSMATGGLFGAATGQLWLHVWPGTQIGAFAFIAAGAMLATTQRAPLCATALLLELTNTGAQLIVPLALATTGALITNHVLSRHAGPRAEHPPATSYGPLDTARWADGSAPDRQVNRAGFLGGSVSWSRSRSR